VTAPLVHGGAPAGTDRHRLIPYEPALDGIRGLAVAGVVTYHACAQSGTAAWVRGGFVGVSVFLTLSGFLITWLLLREHESTGRIDVGHFWARRIRRLVPAALTVVLAVVVLSGVVDVLSVGTGEAVAATWSVTNWHVIASGDGALLQTIVGPLGPTWSLGVEEQFYVVLLVLIVLAFRTRQPRRTLAIVSAVGVAAPIVLTNVVSTWQPRLEFGTDVRAAEPFVGVALALWWTSTRPPRWRRSTADVVATIGIATMITLFVVADYTPPWLLRGGYPALSVVTALTLVGLLHHGVVGGVMSARPIVALGELSYSLYLVHWPVMSIMSRDRTGIEGIGLAALQLTASLAASTVLHLAIERPLRRRHRPPWRPTVTAWLAASAGVTALSIGLL